MTVAVGRDSVVVGEDQILHQLRVSVDSARAAGTLDPALERLFAIALRRASGPLVAPGATALARGCGPRVDRQQVARSGVVAFSSSEPARWVAWRHGLRWLRELSLPSQPIGRRSRGARRLDRARTEAFDPRSGSVASPVSSWRSPDRGRSGAPRSMHGRERDRRRRSLVPAAVPAGLAELLGGRLITADTLALPTSAPQRWTARQLGSRSSSSARRLSSWPGSRTRRSGGRRGPCAACGSRARAELAALWRRFPDLEPETRDAIEGMTRHLADRCFANHSSASVGMATAVTGERSGTSSPCERHGDRDRIEGQRTRAGPGAARPRGLRSRRPSEPGRDHRNRGRPPSADTAWGEGAFVAAIERALQAGSVDVAVHSAKECRPTKIRDCESPPTWPGPTARRRSSSAAIRLGEGWRPAARYSRRHRQPAADRLPPGPSAGPHRPSSPRQRRHRLRRLDTRETDPWSSLALAWIGWGSATGSPSASNPSSCRPRQVKARSRSKSAATTRECLLWRPPSMIGGRVWRWRRSGRS